MVLNIIKTMIRPILGKKKLQSIWGKIFTLSLYGMNIGKGGEVQYSGELNVLKRVRKKYGDKGVILDVGANAGDYTMELLKLFQNSSIHCFEPASMTFAILEKNMKKFNNVIVNNIGLSKQEGTATLYYDKEGSTLASLYNRQLDYYKMNLDTKEEVRLTTIDKYCEDRSIGKIVLLKMDIEGNEYNALKGAKKMLSKGAILSIQIEFGGANIDARTYFRDYWNLLHDDYKVYRIVKDGLYEIKQYDETLEIFTVTNYYFERR